LRIQASITGGENLIGPRRLEFSQRNESVQRQKKNKTAAIPVSVRYQTTNMRR